MILLRIFLSVIFRFLESRGRILKRKIFFVVVLEYRIFPGVFFVALVVFLSLERRFVFLTFLDLGFLFLDREVASQLQ